MPSPGDAARIALGTRSADKIREMRQILRTNPRVQLLSLDELGVVRSPDEDAIELYHTFHQNAAAKALYFAQRTGLPTIADDSGLAVDALNGAPGVHSKRFSHRADLAGADLDRANNQLLLERLAGFPSDRRTAHYVCVTTLALPTRPLLAAVGTCAGRIAMHPRGQGGFGYDPLFLLPDLGVTFAESSPETKNHRSHRARALRALAANLESIAPRG